MATLEEAIAACVLDCWELPDWEQRLPIRPLYVTPDLIRWADTTPRLHDKKLGRGGRTPFEHLQQAFAAFRCDARAHYGDIKPLMPTKHGLWRLCPPKLRIYGWAPAQHAFVAVTGALEIDTKIDRNLNDAKREEVRAFLRAHHLESTVLRGDFLALFSRPKLTSGDRPIFISPLKSSANCGKLTTLLFPKKVSTNLKWRGGSGSIAQLSIIGSLGK